MPIIREEFRKALLDVLLNAIVNKGSSDSKPAIELETLKSDIAELAIEEERFVICISSGKCYNMKDGTALSKMSQPAGSRSFIKADEKAPGYQYFLALFNQLATNKLSYNLWLSIQNQLNRMHSTWVGAVFREPTLLFKLSRLDTTGAHTLAYQLRKQLANYSLEGLKSSDDTHLQNKLLSLKASLADLNRQIQDHLQAKANLTEKLNALSIENFELKKALKQTNDTTLKASQEQVDALTEEKNKLVQQLEQLQKEGEGAIAKIAALEEALLASKQENDALRLLLVGLNEQNELIENALQTLTYEMEETVKEKMEKYDMDTRTVVPSSKFPLIANEHHLSRDDINAQFRRYRGKSQTQELSSLWKKEPMSESELSSTSSHRRTI